MRSLRGQVELYSRLKNRAISLDIETVSWDGPVAVVGLCTENRSRQFVRGQNLTGTALKKEIGSSALLLVFNGKRFDIPKIQAEWPGAISSEISILDLWELAKELGIGTKLKVLERTFGIDRNREERLNRRTHELWASYREGDESALTALLDYNRADTRNLFQLAEELTKWASWKVAAEDWRIWNAVSEICVPKPAPEIERRRILAALV